MSQFWTQLGKTGWARYTVLYFALKNIQVLYYERKMYLLLTGFFSTGGVILYAGSSGSASPSPGSPSSGYQTQSPSTHSQPSSPEEVTFTEIGALKQHGSSGNPPSPKLVFQFPEIYSSSTASSNQNTYSHPIAGKRPCGFTGTFTSKHQISLSLQISCLVITLINQFLLCFR